MSVNIKLELDENAIRDLVQDAFEEQLANTGVDYECPECGAPLVLTTGSNACPKCGFIIEAVPGELEL